MHTEKLNDPICGMTVTHETAVGTINFQGVTYGFCSDYCQETFVTDPPKFLALAATNYPALFGDKTETST